MNILIYSLAKSGTTALLYTIFNASKKHDKFVFEPFSLSQVDYSSENLLVKSVYANRWKDDQKYFNRFEKKILLVRNPLDRVVSSLLYLPYNGDGFTNDNNTKRYLNCLLDIVSSENTLADLDQLFSEITGRPSVITTTIKQSNVMVDILKSEQGKQFFPFKYEDFVSDNLSDLSEYLELQLQSDVEVGALHKRTKRSGKFNEYQKYFNQEQVEHYANALESFSKSFNYTFEFKEGSEKISLEKTFNYTMRVINEYRNQYKLPEYIHGDINVGNEGELFDKARRDFMASKYNEALTKLDEIASKNPKMIEAVDLLKQKIEIKMDT